MLLRVFDKVKNLIKILGSSKQTVVFIVLIYSIPMKLSVPERQIKVIVLPQRKMF